MGWLFMIQPIAIRLIDRDEDLNFYKLVKPINVTIVDFKLVSNELYVALYNITISINVILIVITIIPIIFLMFFVLFIISVRPFPLSFNGHIFIL